MQALVYYVIVIYWMVSKMDEWMSKKYESKIQALQAIQAFDTSKR